jgi:hypothetical protein
MSSRQEKRMAACYRQRKIRESVGGCLNIQQVKPLLGPSLLKGILARIGSYGGLKL